jgi:hypothetical protein
MLLVMKIVSEVETESDTETESEYSTDDNEEIQTKTEEALQRHIDLVREWAETKRIFHSP